MITLSYGVKKPEDGDKGTAVFSALNGNADILNNHDHDGVDSAKILSSNIQKEPLNLSSIWTATGTGTGYKQTVNLPGAYTLANCQMRFRVRTGTKQNRFINPTIDPISLTQFEIIVNEQLELEVLFI